MQCALTSKLFHNDTLSGGVHEPCVGKCVYTYSMFDRVVHDDVIFPYLQPGAKCDDIAISKRFGALPCARQTRLT